LGKRSELKVLSSFSKLVGMGETHIGIVFVAHSTNCKGRFSRYYFVKCSPVQPVNNAHLLASEVRVPPRKRSAGGART
jgi:hypothetical protein